jgi:hypothetical protein
MKRQSYAAILTGVALLAAITIFFTVSELTMKTLKLDPYEPQHVSAIPREKWAALANRSVFFGHMSVGFNIMDGVSDILKNKPDVPITIREISSPAEGSTGGFCHAAIGYNVDPLGKMNSFREFVKAMKPAPDIAFMKFCYVDFYSLKDYDAAVKAYAEMISDLQNACPETVFLHCTVPLTTGPQSLKRQVKDVVKSVLGKATTTDHNASREAFSAWLRQTYPADTIIDIALSEATTDDGLLRYKSRKGSPVPFLRDEYTYDGGHLNERGRIRAAEALLHQLLAHVD